LGTKEGVNGAAVGTKGAAPLAMKLNGACAVAFETKTEVSV